MKIIGQTSDGFILEISENEAYNLNGFYWRGEQNAPKIGVGSIFEVHKMFDKLYTMQAKKERVDEAAKNLRFLADNIEVLQREVEEIIED